MHRDHLGHIRLNPTSRHHGPTPSPGAAHVAACIAEQKAKAAAKRELYLTELWGPIQRQSSVLLSDAASFSVNPGVRTAQGLIQLDGVVTDFDGDHCWVQVIFLSPRKSQGVVYERINLHRRDVDYFGLEPTAWMLNDLRRSAITRSRRLNLIDGWGHLRSDIFMEH